MGAAPLTRLSLVAGALLPVSIRGGARRKPNEGRTIWHYLHPNLYPHRLACAHPRGHVGWRPAQPRTGKPRTGKPRTGKPRTGKSRTGSGRPRRRTAAP
ncbi:MAG: hypothetical protein EB034_00870 [Verrucomicrobia bacterium]|nr:hypothetical protein [Verrucomicrobiota bacterium]